MSTEVTLQLDTIDTAGTEAFGERLGGRLRGGEVIELSSDLGGGKTTLVRGLARGAGSTDQVASPTFTVSKEYDCGRLRIYHFDFYRLPEAGIVAQELAEILTDNSAVIVVEWSDAVRDVLPAERLSIVISRVRSGEEHRRLDVRAAVRLTYLLDGES